MPAVRLRRSPWVRPDAAVNTSPIPTMTTSSSVSAILRTSGIAQRAMVDMCRRLFLDVPVVSLYVHGANTPAIRLYESIGFEHVGLVRAVWFDDVWILAIASAILPTAS